MTFHELILLFTIFVLAVFLGFELISKVPPTLHTPLMSGSNAISGITIVGSLVSAGSSLDVNLNLFGYETSISSILGFIAIIFATINVVGGYLVTDRMTRMFKKK
ncbi:MAG: pyridine nucleotide transhydrogenase subunit alpha [Leptospiraceae bacterium]|nr:MAG: pyridine nucleotide transhydrogenase subunit alpha [Leptospiraceae bacterium]